MPLSVYRHSLIEVSKLAYGREDVINNDLCPVFFLSFLCLQYKYMSVISICAVIKDFFLYVFTGFLSNLKEKEIAELR